MISFACERRESVEMFFFAAFFFDAASPHLSLSLTLSDESRRSHSGREVRYRLHGENDEREAEEKACEFIEELLHNA